MFAIRFIMNGSTDDNFKAPQRALGAGEETSENGIFSFR